MSSAKKPTSSGPVPSHSHGHDLVTASMTVTAPSGRALTGNLTQVKASGKNTAWAKPEIGASVPRYQSRKAYMQENHADHGFAEAFMARHDKVDADKRGMSCAEGHSVIESHQRLASAGRSHALAGELASFKRTLLPFPELPALPSAPTFGPNTKRARKNIAMNAFQKDYDSKLATRESLMSAHEAKLNQMAKSLTGMDSWEHYAAKEASFMAWNDIQQHGQISQVRHDEQSHISPGRLMPPCERCRKDIVLAHREWLE